MTNLQDLFDKESKRKPQSSYAPSLDNRERNDETRAKISSGKKGKRMSQASIDKMALSCKGRKSPMQGRTHTAEARAKMSERHSGGPQFGHAVSDETRAKISAINSKPVMTPNGAYPSIKAVAEASGMPGHTVRRWLKRFPEHYYFITKEV